MHALYSLRERREGGRGRGIDIIGKTRIKFISFTTNVGMTTIFVDVFCEKLLLFCKGTGVPFVRFNFFFKTQV